jgi:hypothetical protein
LKHGITGIFVIATLFLTGCNTNLGYPESQLGGDTSYPSDVPRDSLGSDNNSDTISGATGSEFMAMALEDLNTYDINGSWFEDPYPDASGLSVGVLLDDYSVAPEGCALWWYESEADLNAHVDSNIDFFNSFYFESWVYDAGPAVLLAASGPLDICYISAIIILELEP